MKERNLLKISLVFSLVGIFILFLISQNFYLPDSRIKDLKESGVGNNRFVKLKGIVNKIDDNEKTAVIELIQPEPISVVLFKDRYLDIQEGDYIEVRGMTGEYKGKLQIVGNVVEKIR